MTLHLLAAGASRGLVHRLEPRLRAETGQDLSAIFTAAGAIFDKVVAGERSDLVILTAALLERLAEQGRLVGPIRPIGIARTGIGVPTGHAAPPIATEADLRTAFLTADALYVPDPEISTAGVHLMTVLGALGIAEALGARLRPFPNGATAMRALAAAPEPRALGCTQITEIVDTPGLTVVGPLPAPLGLATLYAAALRADAREPAAARALLSWLTGADTAGLRAAEGFEPPAAA